MWRKSIVLMLVLLGLLSIAALPVAAQTGITWTGEYYNNAVLQAPSAFVRQDNAISFNWGSGSPGSGIGNDNFSARWGTDPYFAAGTYRFWVLADDKVRIYVDFNGQPVINTFSNPSVGQLVAGDLTLSQGVHHIQVDYEEDTGDAYVYVTWANLATNPSGPNFPAIGTYNPGNNVSSGPWTAQYFANTSLSGSPTLIQTEASPSHDWGTGSPVASLPSDNFSARWTSVQTLDAATYQLSVSADDGVKVSIDGVTYINEFHGATGATYGANVNLSAGQHSFLIEYYEASGVAFMNYNFTRLNATQPTPPPVITGAAITVTGAYKLNVRNQPSAVNTTILTKINRNESYPIVGRNSAGTWWQINVNGVVGWVNARYVTARNATNIPITDGTVALPTATPVSSGLCGSAPAPRLAVGHTGRVTPGLPNNIRQSPSTSSALIGQIPSGGVFSVLSGPLCFEGYYWWQITYNGLIGYTPEGANNQYFVEPAS